MLGQRIATHIHRVGIRHISGGEVVHALGVSGIGSGIAISGLVLGGVYHIESKFETKLDTFKKDILTEMKNREERDRHYIAQVIAKMEEERKKR